MVANVRDRAAARVRRYGAAETIDHSKASVIDAARHLLPEGIDVLVDLANDAPEFAALARLVKRGGTALTTRYVADIATLAAAGVSGINFRVQMSAEVRQAPERVGRHLYSEVDSAGRPP